MLNFQCSMFNVQCSEKAPVRYAQGWAAYLRQQAILCRLFFVKTARFSPVRYFHTPSMEYLWNIYTPSIPYLRNIRSGTCAHLLFILSNPVLQILHILLFDVFLSAQDKRKLYNRTLQMWLSGIGRFVRNVRIVRRTFFDWRCLSYDEIHLRYSTFQQSEIWLFNNESGSDTQPVIASLHY